MQIIFYYVRLYYLILLWSKKMIIFLGVKDLTRQTQKKLGFWFWTQTGFSVWVQNRNEQMFKIFDMQKFPGKKN